MLFRYSYKLVISVTQGKREGTKFLWKVFSLYLFIFFKNFVVKARAKFVYKENVTVVEITSTWSSNIRRSYKMVKSRRHRSV